MIKALLVTKGIDEFNRSTDFILNINWRIEKQNLKDRVERHSNLRMFIKLKNEFDKAKLSIWPLKDEEVITWFDTLLLLRRTLNNVTNQLQNISELYTIIEYPLVYGNHMRVDYLLAYSRLVIVLEFGMFNQDEKRSEERYTKKLQESNSYRQILANNIDSSIEVVNYVLIYKPEYDWITDTVMHENKNYNYSEIDKLVNYIIKKINNQASSLAINQLLLLEKDR